MPCMMDSPAGDPAIDLIPVLSGTLAEALEIPPVARTARHRTYVLWLAAAAVVFVGAVIALVAGEIVVSSNLVHGARQSVVFQAYFYRYHAWRIPIVVVLLIVLACCLAFYIPAPRIIYGLLNERSGREQQATACYRR